MDAVVATVSGYHGSERFKLIKLISQSGASYVGTMNPSTTHLVCRKFEGKKYELAKKFKTIVVNHRWIEDCIKQGRRLSERPYMKHSGFVMGPLLLDVPEAADENRSVFGEVTTNSKNSKKTVTAIECDDDDNWSNSWLLKENLLPDLRRNTDRCNRLLRKGTKKCSREDNLLTNIYGLDDSPSVGLRRTESEDITHPSHSHHLNQKRKQNTMCESFKGRRRLMQISKCNEAKSSSDSDENFQHTDISHNDVDIGECSEYCGRHESRRRCKNRFHDHAKSRTLSSEDLEEIEDLGTCNSQDSSAGVDDDSNEREHNPRLSEPLLLSCVICWTEFSSTRGVLPCGHRFCFSCIQNWADHMASMKKVSTCPLCKARFDFIQKMDDALSSDQKIYSQTIPSDRPTMDIYVLPHGEASTHQNLPPPTPVCYQCCCREPEELLISCHSCQIRYVHSYCLDPPQNPWVCVQCKDLRMRYVR